MTNMRPLQPYYEVFRGSRVHRWDQTRPAPPCISHTEQNVSQVVKLDMGAEHVEGRERHSRVSIRKVRERHKATARMRNP